MENTKKHASKNKNRFISNVLRAVMQKATDTIQEDTPQLIKRFHKTVTKTEELQNCRGRSWRKRTAVLDLCCVFEFTPYLYLQMFLPVVLNMALADHHTQQDFLVLFYSFLQQSFSYHHRAFTRGRNLQKKIISFLQTFLKDEIK